MCSSPSARRPSSIRQPDSSIIARRQGAFTVEINPEATPATVDLALRGGAEEVLPQLDRQLDDFRLELRSLINCRWPIADAGKPATNFSD